MKLFKASGISLLLMCLAVGVGMDSYALQTDGPRSVTNNEVLTGSAASFGDYIDASGVWDTVLGDLKGNFDEASESAWDQTPNDTSITILDLGVLQERPVVRFLNKRVPVMRDRSRWYAMVGIPIWFSGMQQLQVDGTERTFSVRPGDYGRSDITITEKKFTQPLTAESLRQIRSEQERIDHARRYIDHNHLELPLYLPTLGVATTPYGFQRYINGVRASTHNGFDIAATTGTDVRAAAIGKVTLAEELFYTGKTVIINHGLGVTTLYAHLSSISVAVDDIVERGELIGAVGSTGRSTGPHLHFGMSVNGVLVDPSLLLAVSDKKALTNSP